MINFSENIPKWGRIASKAGNHRIQEDIEKILVSIFSSCLRTKMERDFDIRYEGYVLKFHMLVTKFLNSCRDDNLDISSCHEDLECFIHHLVLKSVKNLQTQIKNNPESLRKTKKLFKLIPFHLFIPMLKWTNPFRVMEGIVNLSLFQPFGSRNLLQRAISITISFDKTKENIQSLKRKHPKIWRKIRNVISNREVFQSDDIMTPQLILSDKSIPPYFTSNEIANIEDNSSLREEINSLILLETRKKEKETLIELLGDKELTNMIKILVPAIYDPLLRLYNTEDFGSLLQNGINFVKKVIDYEEKDNQSILQDSIISFSSQICQFLLKAFENDKEQSLKFLFKWICQLYKLKDVPFNLEELLGKKNSIDLTEFKVQLEQHIIKAEEKG